RVRSTATEKRLPNHASDVWLQLGEGLSMALPGDALSSEPLPGYFLGARAQVFPDYIDYADGGVGIQDPSLGLNYQTWTAEIVKDIIEDRIMLSAPTHPATTLYTGDDITEVSLAFDQNMNVCVAFVEAGMAKLLWYDTTVQELVVTELGEGVTNPRVALDDTREFNRANSDIILAYLKDGALYYRQQRDRYQIERLLSPGPLIALKRIGRGSGFRFQFQVVVRW